VPEGGNPRAMVLQAYRFVRKTEKNSDGWTMEKAKEWIDKHEAGRAVDAALRVEENLIALADAPLGESLDLLSCQAGESGIGPRHRFHGQQIPDARLDRKPCP